MIFEDKDISVLTGRLKDSGITELSVEQAEKLASETGFSLKAVQWCALDNGIVPLRYKRNIGTLGIDGQKMLLESTVIVCGLGGLGGNIAEQCARSGVGTIIGVDYDVFDATNLNRQILSANDNLGEKKADQAKKRVQKINPAVDFRACGCKFNELEESDWESADVIFDCLDNIPERLILAEKCAAYELPLIHGAIAGWYGQVAVVYPGSTILEMIYKGQKSGIEDETGTPAFTAAATASIMAAKGIKILAGKESEKKGRILFFDLLDDDWQTIDL